jgi:hypothetical protein
MVILDGDGGQLLGLNKVGGRAWELCDGARSVEEIAKTISDEYGEDLARVRADVEQFVRELVEAKLLEV